MYTANKIEIFRPARGRGYESSQRLIFCLLITALFCLTVATDTANATSYYVDPINGNINNDGSFGSPWSTLEEVFDAGLIQRRGHTSYPALSGFPDTEPNIFEIKNPGTAVVVDGDTIKLRTGYHGELDELEYYNTDYITIESEDGCTPTFGHIRFESFYKWILRGLTVNVELSGVYDKGGVISVADHGHYGSCSDIIIENCDVRTVSDESSSGWSADDWLNNASGGICVEGKNNIIRNNTIRNVIMGIISGGDNALVENNTITQFTADGLRVGSGDNQTWQYNIVKNAKAIGIGHRDGIQIYVPTVTVHGMTIRGNKIIEYEDSDQPFASHGLHGIFSGCNKENWVIENNLVVVDHLWGIYVSNISSSTIVINTVVRPSDGTINGSPVIKIGGSYNSVNVNNNIAHSISDRDETNNLIVNYNIELNKENYNSYDLFTDYDNYDFTLKKGSPAIDTGSSLLAPSIDIDKESRPQGAGFDIGCYEYVDPNSKSYSITASAGDGGQIIPSGTTQVVQGGSQTYNITESTGYHIDDVVVDGNSVGAVTSYPFTNVTANHTIAVTFAADTTYYTITSSAGSGGQIIPSGTTQVASGGSQVYTITVSPGYRISDVVVDGIPVGDVTRYTYSYTFTNVVADHTITANFVAITTYSITAIAGEGGSITPSGDVLVNEGENQAFTITADAGCQISDVVVDGGSVGDVNRYTYSYTFTNVTADHTIAATFAIDEQDDTAPTVTNLSPQADSIQAPLNTLVILDITDSGKGVDANSVTINVNDNIVYSGNTATHSSTYGKCHRIGTKAHYAFIYQSNEMFDFDQPINVTAKAADLAGNVMNEYSYSFKTEMRSFGRNKQVDSRDIKKGRPVTVCDNSGNIWAAWHAGVTGSRDIYIGKLEDGAVNFGSSVQLTSDAAECNPVTAVGSDGKLYVAWQDNRRGNWDIYISTSNDWSAEIRVTDSNDNQINPAIVVDSSLPNNAYIVWEDDRNGNQDIYVAKSSNGFATKTVSQITSDASDQVEPAIAVDSDNTIYVVWTDTRNGGKNDIYGAASNNGLWTNVPIVPIVTEEESQSSPAIAAEAVGSILHLVWVDDRTTDGDDDIFYDKTSGGLTPLTGSSIIDDDTGADQISPVIITTGTGDDLKVFACWRDERWANADLYLAEISSDYSAKISSGDKANVFVGDDGTNSDQSEPAIGIDGDGQPYLVWTNEKTDICYAGSTFIDPDALASTNVSITSEATVGTMRNAIQSVDDVSAEVPQGAYLCDVEVTISRIKNPQKFHFERSTGVYEFGPSGMEFTKPVTITIPYEVNGSENVSYRAYWYNSLTNTLSQQGITDVETIVISSNLHALRFKTTHFSPFIIGGAVLGGLLGGGGGGGGCSMSPDSQDGIAELLLPYIGLAVAMVVLKLRDRRKRKAHNITKSEC